MKRCQFACIITDLKLLWKIKVRNLSLPLVDGRLCHIFQPQLGGSCLDIRPLLTKSAGGLAIEHKPEWSVAQ